MCRDDQGFGDDSATAELIVVDSSVICFVNVSSTYDAICILTYFGDVEPDIRLTADGMLSSLSVQLILVDGATRCSQDAGRAIRTEQRPSSSRYSCGLSLNSDFLLEHDPAANSSIDPTKLQNATSAFATLNCSAPSGNETYRLHVSISSNVTRFAEFTDNIATRSDTNLQPTNKTSWTIIRTMAATCQPPTRATCRTEKLCALILFTTVSLLLVVIPVIILVIRRCILDSVLCAKVSQLRKGCSFNKTMITARGDLRQENIIGLLNSKSASRVMT